MSQNDPRPDSPDDAAPGTMDTNFAATTTTPAHVPGEPDRFAKWTNEARAILAASEREAVRLGDHFIGDEHILLGVLNGTQTLAAKILADEGITLEQVRNVVAAMPGRGSGVVRGDTLTLTPKGKQAIVHAVDEARARKQKCVDATDVLLGLTYQGCVTCEVLRVLGVSPRTVNDLASRRSVLPATSPTMDVSCEPDWRQRNFLNKLLRRR